MGHREVALQIKQDLSVKPGQLASSRKTQVVSISALAFDDNLPYKMTAPSKVCDTPIIKAFTLTRNGIAGSASHIGHPAHSSGVQLGIEPSCNCSQLGLGLSLLGARWGL